MEIIKLKDVAKQAFAEIGSYQKGEKKTIKTGRPYIDESFPLVNGSVITISASSGVGKSFELATLLDNIMNRDINPDASNYVCLNVSLEMKVLSLVLRGLNKSVGKSKRKILLEEFTPEEKELANAYYKQLMDERFYISQVPTTPSKFYTAAKDFCIANTDKDTILISADHIALFGSDGNKGKNQVIEELIERTNDLKMMFPNVIFIYLSQVNSDSNARIQEKSIMSQPRDTDLYYSQFTFQVSDYVVVITNPYKKGINEYTKVNKQRYKHLEKYFTGEDSKGRASLKTLGVLYYHLLKCREAESLYIDIFAEDLNIPNIEQYEEKEEKVVGEEMPVFVANNNSLNKIAWENSGADSPPF